MCIVVTKNLKTFGTGKLRLEHLYTRSGTIKGRLYNFFHSGIMPLDFGQKRKEKQFHRFLLYDFSFRNINQTQICMCIVIKKKSQNIWPRETKVRAWKPNLNVTCVLKSRTFLSKFQMRFQCDIPYIFLHRFVISVWYSISGSSSFLWVYNVDRQS
jgi:hypothetical protein